MGSRIWILLPNYLLNRNTMARKVLNEAALKKIIAEAMTAVLKEIYEIGDTNQGYDAIRRAQAHAKMAGRINQANKFRDYADKLDQDKYGLVSPEEVKDEGLVAVNQKNIVYKANNDVDKYIVVTWEGRILTKTGVDSGKWTPCGDLINGVPRYAKLDGTRKAEARKIAAWCARYLRTDVGAKTIASNWHNWVLL